MANYDNQNHPFICDRTTGEKIPVSKEVRDAYYGEAARIRMKEQAHGRCVCPQSKVWACDGDCLICEYRRSGNLASLDVPIGKEGEKLDVSVEESERLKKLQRELFRRVKGSNNRRKTIKLIQREYQKLLNRKQDKANKIVSKLKKYDRIYI